jgi:hypothetical protein
MKRSVMIAAAAGMFLAAAMAFPAGKPRVEVAFVLDSTGSMGGLIEGAKQKIWSIANSIIVEKPTPEVRIGLVTYRDRGDEYVTKTFDLTEDIDAVYKNLKSFVADGGGDDPESVNEGLHVAVTGLSWSKDPDVLKMMFLVGDYPPHMDYPDDVKYPVTCREAVTRGIRINTVQVGSVPQTTPVWQDIARRAEGSFVALAGYGNAPAIRTPFDDEIARTSAALGATLVPYGDRAHQAEAVGKVESAAGAPASVAADRAAYNLASGGKAIQGAGDLVAEYSEGTVDPAMLPAEVLSPEMQKMTPAERTRFIERQKQAREKLNQSLAELGKKRADYVSVEEKKRAASGAADSFDVTVAAIIAEEARRTSR